MSPELALLAARRRGLRIAVAVAVGLALGVAADMVIPFLGPFFAIQFLMAPRPPGLPQAIGITLLIVAAGAFMLVLMGVVGQHPPALIVILGLIYFACFLPQALGRSGAAGFLILVVAIVVPMLDLLKLDLGESIIVILAEGVVIGMLLTWAAHAVFPDPLPPPLPAPAPQPTRAASLARAAASAAILLAMVAICISNDEMSAAMVVPITVATLLGQLDVGTSLAAATELVLVNVFGGVVAALAFTIYEVRPSLLWLFMIVLLAGLIFGGRASADRAAAKVYGGAFMIFVILFGLGVSPLPTSTPESFATRIGYILLASIYTITLAALVWAGPREREATGR